MLSKRMEYNQRHAMLQNYKESDVRNDAAKFLRAHMFTERLRKHAGYLTMQEYGSLRQQALDGDVEGASKRLVDIMRNKAWKAGEM